ncbi:MAG TPA: molybdate ABC transporter substrate-binding protein [Myxococcaceae bacterium]|nr:molybdate ABC transporter substrate-binding protein [Myxococcaceae bacterium]
MTQALLIALSLAAGDPAPQKELVVLAAASLRDAFTDLAKTFEASHPGVHVTLSFAGSQELRAQVVHGMAADVFASADAAPLQALQTAGLARPPTVFARNSLVVVVPQGNPSAIATFNDLPKARKLVVGIPESPIGGYTLKVFQRAGFSPSVIEKRIASRELNARQVLAKVSLGEADAGVVYRTDALTAKGKVAIVEIPAAVNEIAEYPVAALTHGKHPDLAQAFIALLTGADGQRALAAQGFLPASTR